MLLHERFVEVLRRRGQHPGRYRAPPRAKLPAGVRVEFDLHAQDILQSLREAAKKQGTKAQRWYRAYRETHGTRPAECGR